MWQALKRWRVMRDCVLIKCYRLSIVYPKNQASHIESAARKWLGDNCINCDELTNHDCVRLWVDVNEEGATEDYYIVLYLTGVSDLNFNLIRKEFYENRLPT